MDHDTAPHNGAAADDGYIPFADGATQRMSRELAEQFLRLAYTKHRAIFAQLLAEAITGELLRLPIQHRERA